MSEKDRVLRGTAAEILRGYRVAAGLTQEQLAERSGLSVRAISDLERGRSVPRQDSLRRLAAALDLSPEQRATFFVTPSSTTRRPFGTALAARLDSPLLDREQAVAQLMRNIAGEGRRVLLFTGEPGIGKTRLLQEAAQQGADAGYTVLTGGFERRDGQEPYGALCRMLRGYIRTQPPAVLGSQLQGCAWLVSLLPELAGGPLESLPAQFVPSDQQRDYLVAAVARFLRNVAGPAGTLLILDDLQWVDADTLDLCGDILRSTSDFVPHVIAAYRDTDLRPGDPLDTMLNELAAAGLAQQQTLQPLSPDAARDLLCVLLDGVEDVAPDRLRRVLERAGGVPFYLVSYAHGLQTGANEDVPWDVARSVRQRLAALAPETQRVLEAAAIFSGEVRRDRLVPAVSLPEESVYRALDEACHARIVVEEGGNRVRFAHYLIREVIERDLGAGHRAGLHLRIARALEHTEGDALPVEELAHHYGEANDAAAATYFEMAGDRALEQGASHVAERSYHEAIDRFDETDRALDAARVRQKLGRGLRSAGRGYDRALEALERAAAEYRQAGDWEQLGRTAAEIAYLHVARGTAREGLAQLGGTRLLLETEVALGAPGVGLAHLEAALAQLYLTGGMQEEHLGALERAALLAREADDPAMLATAELSRGAALVIMGRVPESVTVLEEGGRLAEAANNLPALVTALVTASALLVNMAELQTALSHLRRAREVAERLGDLVTLSFIHFLQGEALRFSGQWDQAQISYEHGLRLAEQVEGTWVGWTPAMGLGLLALDRGELEEAVRFLLESRRQAARSGYPFAVPWVECTLAMHALHTGRTEEANTRLQPLRDLPPIPGVTHIVLYLQAWTHLQAGDLDAAADTAVHARASAAAERARTGEINSLWVQARVETARGRWVDAERDLEQALALARGGPYVPGELRLLEAYAMLEKERGDLDAARRLLEDVVPRLRRLGAQAQVERLLAEFPALTEIQ